MFRLKSIAKICIFLMIYISYQKYPTFTIIIGIIYLLKKFSWKRSKNNTKLNGMVEDNIEVLKNIQKELGAINETIKVKTDENKSERQDEFQDFYKSDYKLKRNHTFNNIP